MRLFIAVMVLNLAVTGAAAEGDRAAGDLEIARKGQALIARLTLPAEQVVGFSHRPESDEEKIAVTEALARLGKADNVLVPAAEAGCTVTREEATTTLMPPATPDPAEFQARYAWRCESPDGLVAADVPLLEFLNGVALDALVVNGEHRFERRIAPPETRLPLLAD